MKFIGKTRSVQELAVHILEPERTGSTRYVICEHSPNRRAKANAIVVSNLTPQYRGNHWKQTKISPKTRRPEERSFPKETRRFKNREAVIPILLILSLFWFPLLCTGASLFFLRVWNKTVQICTRSRVVILVSIKPLWIELDDDKLWNDPVVRVVAVE